MPSDYSKCTGENCPIKHTCKRYTTPAEDYQCWTLYILEIVSMGYLCYGFERDLTVKITP